jgi:hypothetical protein
MPITIYGNDCNDDGGDVILAATTVMTSSKWVIYILVRVIPSFRGEMVS